MTFWLTGFSMSVEIGLFLLATLASLGSWVGAHGYGAQAEIFLMAKNFLQNAVKIIDQQFGNR